jgi:hypothetical protein
MIIKLTNLASTKTVKCVNYLNFMVIDLQNFLQLAFEINFYFSYTISAKKLEIAAFFLSFSDQKKNITKNEF